MPCHCHAPLAASLPKLTAAPPPPSTPHSLLIDSYISATFFAMNYFGSSACEIFGQTIGKRQQQLTMSEGKRGRGGQGVATLTTANEYDAWNNNNEMTTKGTANKRIAIAGRSRGWGGAAHVSKPVDRLGNRWAERREGGWGQIKIQLKCDFWSLWKLLISYAWAQPNEIGRRLH